MALGRRNCFGQPLALAHDNRLIIAIPNLRAASLFQPPNFRKPAASRAGLVQLYDDVAAVLAAADSVIDLDYAARAVAGSPANTAG
jgi:hypothetical protein